MSNVTFHLGNQTIIIHDNDGDNHFDARRDTLERRSVVGSAGHHTSRTDTYTNVQATRQMRLLFGNAIPLTTLRRLDYGQLRLMASHIDMANTRANANFNSSASWLRDVGSETNAARNIGLRAGVRNVSEVMRYVTFVRRWSVEREVGNVRRTVIPSLQGQTLFTAIDALDTRVRVANLMTAVGYSDALRDIRIGALERESSRVMTALAGGSLRGRRAFDAVELLNNQTASWGVARSAVYRLDDLNALLDLIYRAGPLASTGDSRFTELSGQINTLVERYDLPRTRLEELSGIYTRNH